MEYKESYKGLVIFFIGFVLVLAGMAYLSALFFYQHIVRVSISVVSIAMTLLSMIVCKTQNIYWYNGIEYEDAVEAGEKRRKSYAPAHHRMFGMFTAMQLVFSLVMGICAITQWVDFAVSAVGLCMVAIGTLKIKL
jgi:hypothetical protein